MHLQNLRNNVLPRFEFWDQLRLVYKKAACLTNRLQEKQAAMQADITAVQKAPQKQWHHELLDSGTPATPVAPTYWATCS